MESTRTCGGVSSTVKFHQGLNPKVQDHMACLTLGHPSNDSPKQWYDTAILYDENCIANDAFQTSLQIASPVQTLSNAGGML
jgi:hypothetical protein